MKKRVLSALLALALCLGFTPALSRPAQAAMEESFTYTAPDGVVYFYGRETLNSINDIHFLVQGYEGEPTHITIPSVVEGTYINRAGDEVAFTKRVEGIMRGAFDGCSSLETVTIQGCPILDNKFSDCSSLRVLDLSQCTATRLWSNFAYGCGSLETVRLPATLTTLGTGSFSYCPNLRDVYFLAPAAPEIYGTSLHNFFQNAAVFHVPANGTGYDATKKDDAYQHAVVYGDGETVPYGADFTLRTGALGSADDAVIDMGTLWAHDSRFTKRSAAYAVENTGSDTLTFTVTKGSGNSGHVSCSAPYNSQYSGRLFPGQTVKAVPIELDLGFDGTPGTYEETFTITGTGYTTQETHSEAITVRYTVKGKEDAFTLSRTEVDFGDIPLDLSLDDMPTVTITATNHMPGAAYLSLPMTDHKNSANPCYAEYVGGNNKTAIYQGESVTFRLRISPRGLEQIHRDGGSLNFSVSLLDRPISSGGSAHSLGDCNITLKANPVYSDGLSLSTSLLDLGSAKDPYNADLYNRDFSVTNTGTRTVTLTVDDSAYFGVLGKIGTDTGVVVEPGDSASGTIRPNYKLKPGVYEETLTIRGGDSQVRLRVRFVVEGEKAAEGEKKETMALSTSYLDFGRLPEGYEQPKAKTVTVENTGTETITLTQPTAWNYEVGRLSRTTLAAGETAAFTVAPKTGLKAYSTGTRSYAETISLHTSTGLTGSLEVYFTVVPKEAAPVVFDPADMPSVWAREEVTAAIMASLVPQSNQSRYTEDITRAEFCALATQLYETVKGGEITGRSTFTDTDDVNVQKMAYLTVVNGRGDGIFDPDSGITRQEAAAILARLADAMGKTLPACTTSYTDQELIAAWAVMSVGQVNGAGIMKGTDVNTFSPLMRYTREQSILTVMRLYRYMTEQS